MCTLAADVIYVFVLFLYKARLQMMHGLRVFDALELKFTPFKFVLRMEMTL